MVRECNGEARGNTLLQRRIETSDENAGFIDVDVRGCAGATRKLQKHLLLSAIAYK